MNLGEWLRHAEARLVSAGIETPRIEVQMLACHILRVDRTWLLTHPEHEFPELAGEGLLQRRERREPLAYILGWREFFGRRFAVSQAVLIPRQDTEILVEAALELDARTVLDIGTGSGCIASTLKLERPAWSVTAVDISESALELATQNGKDLGAEVEWVLSDGFESLGQRRFDVVVSNPPYIGEHEPLEPEVRVHEPSLALFSGEDGLEFYKRLAKETPAHLEPDGQILLEVGYQQATAVRELFEAQGWIWKRTVNDLSGIARVVHLCWPA